MAGNILHGSQTSIQLNSKGSTNLPSIFDFLAQDSLRASLRPGIRAAVKLLAQKFPKLGSIVDRQFDEFFLLFEAMLENHFLKKFSASFAENFYALKRVPVNAGASMKLFRHRMRSLLALVIVPYIANKLEKLHQRLMDTPATGNSQQQSSPMRRLFLRFFPHLKALILLALFLFQAGYTFSLLPVPSPLLLLAKCRLERLSAEDLRQMEGADGPLHLRRGSILSSLWRIFLWLPSAAGRLLSYGLFLLQILEYCYTDSLGKHFAELVSGQRIKIPEYPFQTLPSEQQVLCMEVDKCPLCKKTRQQDTVLSVSGYVFCHSCIYNFLLLEARCPVTSLPATTNELVKIYHS